MKSATMSQLARVNVLLTAEEAERFSDYCVRKGFKKSTLIARLVREYLDREDPPRRKSKGEKEQAA